MNMMQTRLMQSILVVVVCLLVCLFRSLAVLLYVVFIINFVAVVVRRTQLVYTRRIITNLILLYA